MEYSKLEQLGKKTKTRTQVNRIANRKLEKLKIEKDVRHCELCSTQATSNAHRHPRVWYRGNDSGLWDYNQVIFLCAVHHARMDDRSKTTEEEKEEIFNSLR